MKILIASTYIPFCDGGGKKIVAALQKQLVRRGYEAEAVLIPLHSRWRDLPEQIVGLRLLDLTESAGNRIDLLITVRYPSFALRHPNKVAWFLDHQEESAEFWGAERCVLPETADGRRFAAMKRQADERYLGECKKIFTVSGVVAAQLNELSPRGHDGILYPPLADDHPFKKGPSGNYFVYSARIHSAQRQQLAVEALKHARGDYHLVLIGDSDSSPATAALRTKIRELGLESRVRLLCGLSEHELAEILSGCRACLDLPHQEDYGYATLQSFFSHKPVITCRDSGAPAELIQSGYNGFVVEPTPQALAEVMDRLWRDQKQTEKLGAAAGNTPAEKQITWDHLIERMVA